MISTRPISRAFAAFSVSLGLLTASAQVAPALDFAAPGGVQVAQGDCYAIGAQYAARQGGQLAKATPEQRGGQQVCVVIVLLPAKDGQRPRREEVVLPLR